jgi:hypothetical protein
MIIDNPMVTGKWPYNQEYDPDFSDDENTGMYPDRKEGME